jgi:hypothetical protein
MATYTARLDNQALVRCGQCGRVLGEESSGGGAVRFVAARVTLPPGVQLAGRGYEFTKDNLGHLRYGRFPRLRRRVRSESDGADLGNPSRPLLPEELPVQFRCPWCRNWNVLAGALATSGNAMSTEEGADTEIVSAVHPGDVDVAMRVDAPAQEARGG